MVRSQRAALFALASLVVSPAALVAACSSSSNPSTPPSSDAGGTTPDTSVTPGLDSSAPDTSTPTSDVAAADASNDAGTTADTSPAPDAADGGAATILIADQFNNRLIEIDYTGKILWTFGDGTSVPGPTSVVAPNDAERLPNGNTLVAGTGAPQNAEPSCTAAIGCPDNRVLIVDHSGAIVWQYGQAADAGSGPDQLNTPVAAVMLPSGNVLITDQGNARVIEVTPSYAIAWQFPPADADAAADAGTQLNNPNSAERLANGNTLIADENNNRVIEVTNAGAIVWQYPAAPDTTALNGAAFASRLPSGNTLITDSNNNRIIEVTPALSVAWTYATNTRTGSNPNPLPTRGVRLANGDTLISDQFNHQVIEVNPAKTIVFSYGQLNVAGAGAGQLNGPYDAKVVGDFTGLTPPQ